MCQHSKVLPMRNPQPSSWYTEKNRSVLRSEIRKRCPHSPFLFNTVLEVLVLAGIHYRALRLRREGNKKV